MQKLTYTGSPIRLIGNRIYRAYPGGREIERFRGNSAVSDDLAPEAWVGSTTLTKDHDSAPDHKRGYAQAVLPDGSVRYLREIIDDDPNAYLGEKHVVKFGNNPSVLVKLLDAEKQLGLQCHPDRAFAKEYFNSDFGKVESWYVIGLREDQEEKPYLLQGFKAGITREKFQELFLKGDIRAMENWCHKIYPKVGDMFYVSAGCPHAIGPGCFVVEVQEPSDITVGACMQDFDTPQARDYYIEQTMGSYHYDGRDEQGNLDAYRVLPKTLLSTDQGKETLLLGSEQTPYFGITKTELTGSMEGRDTGTFRIVIILDSKGTLSFEGGRMDVKKGDELFLPAGVKNLRWEAQGQLSLVCCYPPEVF